MGLRKEPEVRYAFFVHDKVNDSMRPNLAAEVRLAEKWREKERPGKSVYAA